jgi:hypothetical protein
VLDKAFAPFIAQQANENSAFYLQICQMLNVFWPIQAAFVAGEPLCDL